MAAQAAKTNFSSQDRKIGFIKEDNLDSLARKLAQLGSTDREKARAVFRWIAEHISYNVRIYNRNRTDPGNFYEEPDDSSAALPSLNERVAAKVLKRKMAFCDGYSRLFAALCTKMGIPTEVIHGYARTSQTRQGKFGVNHSWNAVYLENSWHLLDVTWASGFVSYSSQYIKQYNDYYFLTPPADFFRDHYPEDIQWALLDQLPLYREFNQAAFRHSGFNKYAIISFIPQKGIIEAAAGDTIRFEIKTKKEIRNFLVADAYQPASFLFLQPARYTVSGEKINFNYFVKGNEGGWLYLFFNEEAVLCYKFNLNKN
ncbi:MAG TPA: transglutaminase domain-containing protein [Chitinophagaceae bacterium]|nr:transglutaminase domain-containing protein [Chitinophagaceae bacterium]